MNLDQKIENLYRPSNRITTRIIHVAIPHGAIREIERVIGLETDEYFKIEADDLSMEYIFEYSEIICVELTFKYLVRLSVWFTCNLVQSTHITTTQLFTLRK
jgi:hypothetical protein